MIHVYVQNDGGYDNTDSKDGKGNKTKARKEEEIAMDDDGGKNTQGEGKTKGD